MLFMTGIYPENYPEKGDFSGYVFLIMNK